MKKILFLACCVTLTTGFSIEYSLRIKALGPDFAYLILDYESDLYRDPNLYTRDNKFLEIIPGTPFSVKLLTSRFGLMGRYQYNYSHDYHYFPSHSQWDWSRSYTISIKDLWMWDARKLLPGFLGDVWNLTNDLNLYSSRDSDNGGSDSTSSIKYLLGIPGSSNIGQYFKIYSIVAGGVYKYNYWHYYYQSEYIDQTMFIITGKIGISFRNNRSENDFISAYIETGGPVSTAEIDSMPWPVMSHMLSDHDTQMPYFLKPMISRIAFVKGIPINDQSFIAVGFRDQFRYQRFNEADTNITLTGINNTSSLPLAVEYRINSVAIRLGTDIIYDIAARSEKQNNINIFRWIDHHFTWSSTCGIGWRLGQKFDLDLYKKGISLYHNDIEICLKFLF